MKTLFILWLPAIALASAGTAYAGVDIVSVAANGVISFNPFTLVGQVVSVVVASAMCGATLWLLWDVVCWLYRVVSYLCRDRNDPEDMRNYGRWNIRGDW